MKQNTLKVFALHCKVLNQLNAVPVKKFKMVIVRFLILNFN